MKCTDVVNDTSDLFTESLDSIGMAGLLTYTQTFGTFPSLIDSGISPKIAQGECLQHREMSGIYTQFPFNFN